MNNRRNNTIHVETLDHFSLCEILMRDLIFNGCYRHFFQIEVTQSGNLEKYYNNEIFDSSLNLINDCVSSIGISLFELYSIGPGVFVLIVNSSEYSINISDFIIKLELNFRLNQLDSPKLEGVDLYMGATTIHSFCTPEYVLNTIKKACDYAKRQSSGRVAIYNTCTKYEIDRAHIIQCQLKKAIEKNQIFIVLQPIYKIDPIEIISYEVLARWNHPDLGIVSPEEFIPIAEEQGIIHNLGLEVINKACEFLEMNNIRKNDEININVNVSAMQIMRDDFTKRIKEIADAKGVRTSCITLEVTESVLLDNNKNTLKVFDELQRLGFKLSLDDFGSGYSTVSTFFNFPFSQIKIDRHLVERSQNNLSCQDFIRFLTKFANSNGIETVAEGIEYLDQIKQLKNLKVTHVQGFALGRPVDTTKWLKFYR